MKILTSLTEMINSVFGTPPIFLDAGAKRKRDQFNVKSICMDLARGNVSLINGYYMTRSELESRRAANLSHKYN